jgi:hypothetical protein
MCVRPFKQRPVAPSFMQNGTLRMLVSVAGIVPGASVAIG